MKESQYKYMYDMQIYIYAISIKYSVGKVIIFGVETFT